MKKFLLTLMLSGGAVLTCFAQSSNSSTKFSIGLDAAAPNGVASNAYSAGFGGAFKVEVPAATSLYGTFSVGYEAFFTKTELKNIGYNSSSGFVPIKAGLKNYFNESLFGEAEAGASVYTGQNGGTAFAYSVGMGYTFDGGFEIGVRYEAWQKEGTFGQAALRLGYKF
jgi:hypothetical protein